MVCMFVCEELVDVVDHDMFLCLFQSPPYKNNQRHIFAVTITVRISPGIKAQMIAEDIGWGLPVVGYLVLADARPLLCKRLLILTKSSHGQTLGFSQDRHK